MNTNTQTRPNSSLKNHYIGGFAVLEKVRSFVLVETKFPCIYELPTIIAPTKQILKQWASKHQPQLLSNKHKY